MKVSVLLSPGTNAARQAKRAEELGFHGAYFIDSPVVFGDLYVSMGVAATATERIVIATGVTNPRSRSAPITASMFASLNAFAPGRIAIGIGRGDGANLSMGQRTAQLGELEHFIAVVRSLLRGEVVEDHFWYSEHLTAIQFLNQSLPWVDLEHEIPVYVAAAGPKTIAMACRVADGIILGGITDLAIIDACFTYMGKEKPHVAITPSAYMTEEDVDPEELRDMIGPKSLPAAENFAPLAANTEGVDSSLRQDFARIRAYMQEGRQVGDTPDRHLQSFRNYLTGLKLAEREMITGAVIAATSVAGSPRQCREKIRMLESHGISEVILSPLPQFVDATIESFGTEVITKLRVNG